MPSPPARQRSRERVGALRKDVTEHPPRVWRARVPTSVGLTLLLQLLRTPPRTGGFGPAASAAGAQLPAPGLRDANTAVMGSDGSAGPGRRQMDRWTPRL